MSILSNVLALLACPNCFTVCSMRLTDVAKKKKGLSCYLKIYCDRCAFIHEFYTPVVTTIKDSKRRGMPTMEVNARAVYGFRNIGIGFALITKLCGSLNMPPPMTKSIYDDMSNKIKRYC